MTSAPGSVPSLPPGTFAAQGDRLDRPDRSPGPVARTGRPDRSRRYPGQVTWQGVLDVVDAIESWIAGQSYWVQVFVLLAVLGPLCWLLAGVIDRMVEAVLAWHSRRDQSSPIGAVAGGSTSVIGGSTSVIGGSTPAAGQRIRADP